MKWKLVPTEMTLEMAAAFMDAPDIPEKSWGAMLAASPIPGLDVARPFFGISRAEWHDKAWALYNSKTFDDTMLAKINVHSIRAVFDATYDALTVTPNV